MIRLEYTEVMVRYGELSTKGKNRRDFIAKLADNIQKALSTFPAIKIYPKHDRLHIILNGAPFDEIDQKLKKSLVFKLILQSLRQIEHCQLLKKLLLI